MPILTAFKLIADRLIDALEKVRVNRDPIPDDTWQPVHPVAHLPPDKQDIGLPTGLAVSGILLNVALFPADRFVSDYLDAEALRSRRQVCGRYICPCSIFR